MSNWNGVGTPENGQNLSAGDRKAVKFVGVNSWGHWVIEDENANPKTYNPDFCKPIKTPEQVEEEKEIDDIEILITEHYSAVSTFPVGLAKALHKAGYHNQPKVKELNVNDYCNDPEFPALNYDQRMTLKALIQDGYIIEAKEKAQ